MYSNNISTETYEDILPYFTENIDTIICISLQIFTSPDDALFVFVHLIINVLHVAFKCLGRWQEPNSTS